MLMPYDEGDVNSIQPTPPYIWPEPRKIAGQFDYYFWPPYSAIALKSSSLFGVVSSPEGKGIEALESWTAGNEYIKIKIVVAVYPTSRTTENDLFRLQNLSNKHKERLSIRLHPCISFKDRPTNFLCFHNKDDNISTMALNWYENFGFDDQEDAKVNFIFRPDVVLLEQCRQYFDLFWTRSADISHPHVISIPRLVLQTGSEAAGQQWDNYIKRCSLPKGETPHEIVQINQKTGGIAIYSQNGEELPSPSEELGQPKLDHMANRITRIYEKGSLAVIDKHSRIPPLDAPLDPRIFGEHSEISQGNVSRKVSMRVSIIDEKNLKEIENKRKGIRNILNSFTFSLADNTRWMPSKAMPLFESAVQRLNKEGQDVIKNFLDGDLDKFLEGKKDSLAIDIRNMLKELGKDFELTVKAMDSVVNSLKERLEKAKCTNFMPKLSLSNITFNSPNTGSFSPWPQAFSLLSDIATFARRYYTDPFFLRGIKVKEDDYISAMDVASDYVLNGKSRIGKDRCKDELNIIKEIKDSDKDARDKCELILMLIDGADIKDISCELKKRSNSVA